MSKHSTENRRGARKNSPKVRFESSGRNLTSQASLIPVIKFLDKLGFNGLFNRHVHHRRAQNAHYSLSEGVFLIITGLIGGVATRSRFFELSLLRGIRKWDHLFRQVNLPA